MKILFLADAKSYHTERWVNYFVDSGHQCYLITLDQGFDIKAKEFFVPTRTLPNFLKYPLSLSKIRRIVEEIKPDLVNAHFVPNYGFIGALLKFHPLVISTWGSDVLISPQKSLLHKLRTKYILKKADLVTADAKVSADAVLTLGVKRERVFTCPMGVKRNLIGRPQKKKRPHLIVMSNRKLEPLYDVATLLKAIPLIIEQVKKDVRFVIIGEGSQAKSLLNLSIKLKVERFLDFKGIVPREMLIGCYQDSDIYVSTSLSDSTSVSLLEAMNFGLIPFVTDIPGNREWIQDGKNGFLFPTSNHQALAERIVAVVNEFILWKRFQENNQAIIRSRAVWEENMKIIEDRFQKLVNSLA